MGENVQQNMTVVIKEISTFIQENEVRNTIENMSETNTTKYINDSISDEDLAQMTIFIGYPDGILKFAAVCCIMFMIVGIPGNLITIIALWRSKKVRNATALFIINLTVSDLINCCFNLPFAANTFWTERWLHGSLVCKLFPFARFGLFAVAHFSVLSITINRYILLVYPYVYSRLYTTRNVVIVICSLWMFSFVPVIPTLFGEFGSFGLDRVSGYCNMLPDHNQMNPMKALFLIAFIIPSITILVCYSRIYYIVRKKTLKTCDNKKRVESSTFESNSFQPSEPNSDLKRKSVSESLNQDTKIVVKHPRVTSLRFENSVVRIPVPVVPISDPNSDDVPTSKFIRSKLQLSQLRIFLPTSKDKRLLSMITAIVVSFVVCNLPITAVKMYSELQPHPAAFVYSTILKNFTICVNPLIYVLMSSEYRKAYKKAINFKAMKDVICRFWP